jgi:hypothetical protein
VRRSQHSFSHIIYSTPHEISLYTPYLLISIIFPFIGLDYTDAIAFQRTFTHMSKCGFRDHYHLTAYNGRLCPDGKTPWTPELKWGYLGELVKRNRYANSASTPKREVIALF